MVHTPPVQPPNEIHDTPIRAIVKEKSSATGAKVYSVKVQDHIRWAIEDYAKKNSLSVPEAVRDLLEFRLFQLGELPSWWYERGELLRGTRRNNSKK